MITFDGLLASLMRTRAGMMSGNLDVTLRALDRSRGFLGELLATLNHEKGGEISGRLSSIYVFVLTELQTMVQKPDVKRLDANIGLMSELRDAFAEITATPRSAVA
jgi:flagellar protein FliS